jgi:hypothetical protein
MTLRKTRRRKIGGETSCIKQAIKSQNVTQKLVECVATNGKNINELETPQTPYFVFKYGPTGSGKGSTKVQNEIAKLGLTDNNTVTFEVDKIVEAVNNFRNKSLELKKKYNQNPNNQQVYKNLTNLYFQTRKNTKVNKIQDDLMKEAIQKRRNIIVETTGRSSISWILDNLAGKGYKIVVIYPIVNPSELQKRVVSRAESMKGVFRLPSPSNLETGIMSAKQNILNDLVKLLESNSIDKVILINNN